MTKMNIADAMLLTEYNLEINPQQQTLLKRYILHNEEEDLKIEVNKVTDHYTGYTRYTAYIYFTTCKGLQIRYDYMLTNQNTLYSDLACLIRKALNMKQLVYERDLKESSVYHVNKPWVSRL